MFSFQIINYKYLNHKENIRQTLNNFSLVDILVLTKQIEKENSFETIFFFFIYSQMEYFHNVILILIFVL